MSGTIFYASDSFWNTPIGASPQLASNSAAMVSTALTPYASGANFSNGAFGIGVVYATSSDPTYTISGMQYYNNGPITFQIPMGAQPSTGSDHHLVVINGTQELDMWNAQYNATTNTWTAGSAFVENINGWGANGAPGTKAGGMYASGFSGMGGVVTQGQIATGQINHALSIMIPLTLASYIAEPATATDGRSTNAYAIPEGAHIQLDPSFNVDAQNWPTWEKEIAKALQTYGAYVSDTGGSVAFYGQADANGGMTWAQAGVPNNASLSNLPWQNFQVLSLPPATGGASGGSSGGSGGSGGGTTPSSQPVVVPHSGTAPINAPVTTTTINPTPGSNTMTGSTGGILFNATVGGETVVAGGSGNVINGGNGDTITVTGQHNWIDGNPGSETITDKSANNTVVLPAASQGTDQIYGNVLRNGDAFDLRAALTGSSWNRQASTLSSYIHASSSNGTDTTITLTPQGAGSASSTLAVLHGVGNISTGTFLSHAIA